MQQRTTAHNSTHPARVRALPSLVHEASIGADGQESLAQHDRVLKRRNVKGRDGRVLIGQKLVEACNDALFIFGELGGCCRFLFLWGAVVVVVVPECVLLDVVGLNVYNR